MLLATTEHAPDILPLMAAFNQAESIVWRPDAMVPALHRLLADPALGLALVAYAGPRLVGYSLATFGYDIEFAGRDAFITELFVESSSRGQGLGRRLLEATVQHLQQRNVRAVHLVVRPDNPRARSLYESHGFQASPRILMTKTFEPEES
ncbi:MAG TPA: GNAT family N-acetyltransferase [Polyangiaceae bacterium]